MPITITAKTLIISPLRPPNFERIASVFPLARRGGVIFTYGDTAYFPGNKTMSRELRAHEAVHATRQLAEPHGPEGWWERYLIDPAFRLEEEVLAHAAEYAAYRTRHGQTPKFLRFISERLAGPFYGNLLTVDEAKLAILTMVKR